MTATTPGLAAIVVSHQSIDTIDDCLTRLRDARGVTQIRVVDNGSVDGTLDVIQRHASVDPRLHFIGNPDNPGFGVACNDGARDSDADWLVFVNPDGLVEPDALARLRVIYPNLMQLDYDNQRTRQQQEICAPERTESISPLEHLAAFYQLQNNQPLTAEQTAFCQELIEEIWKEGDTV